MRISNMGRIIAMAAVAAAMAACQRAPEQAPAGTQEPKSALVKYPEPRFPGYLKKPTSVDDLMPTARQFAQQKAWRGGLGLGVANPGETILIINGVEAEDMILEAIKRAAAERNVTVVFKPDYELVGLTKEKAREFRKLRQSFTAEAGYMEASNWVEMQFPEPDKVKSWLKSERPDVYDALYPKARNMSPEMKDIWERMKQNSVGAAIQKYLKANPKIRGVFWGKGGGPGLMRALYPMDKKFMGFFTNDNRWEMMSRLTDYPSDVWLLTEEQAMEPLAYVDRLEVTDPEGTNVWCDVSEEQAERWVKGAYQRGHIYLFPNQATGRFGYSVVDYPALQSTWIPREPMAMLDGVVAATNGHTGFFPRMEIEYKDDYVKAVRGGGMYGEALRTFLKYPGINDVQYPFHTHKGFFYLYEIASGTHPKWFRNPTMMDEGALLPERNRSSVIHWGLGLRLWHDPDAPIESPTWLKFTSKVNMPKDHGWHMHSYFPTYRIHLRNTQKWMNLLDKGHMTALDTPEARALASRYGDPNAILTEDWIPEVPGINVPGDYMKDYAPNPWKYSKMVMDKAVNGTYGHYFPLIQKPAAQTN